MAIYHLNARGIAPARGSSAVASAAYQSGETLRDETTGDLKYCKVWISVLGLENEKEFKKGLRSASGWLRRELGNSLKLRNTPELIFELDHSIEYGAHINELINSLDIKRDEEE